MAAIVSAVKKDQAIEIMNERIAINRRDQVGVRNLECTKEKSFGNCPSVLKAKGSREPLNIMTFKVPNIEMTAPMVIKFPPLLPINPLAASARGREDKAREGSVPIQTNCIRQ